MSFPMVPENGRAAADKSREEKVAGLGGKRGAPYIQKKMEPPEDVTVQRDRGGKRVTH